MLSSDPSFVVVVVGLLGAAMMARKVVKSRHDGVALRRRQYSEVDPTSIQVWSTGKKYNQTYEANK